MRYFFARLDEKHKLLGNFEKILEIFDENSIEKLNFYLFLGKVVAKNRAFGNNIIFLQHFFRLGGGGSSPPNPTEDQYNPLRFITFLLNCLKTGNVWIIH